MFAHTKLVISAVLSQVAADDKRTKDGEDVPACEIRLSLLTTTLRQHDPFLLLHDALRSKRQPKNPTTQLSHINESLR